VEVNISGSSGQLFTSIPSAGTFTVAAAPPPAAPAFTITGSVTPTTISATGSTNISATFTDTGGALTNGNLEVQIYDNNGNSIGGDAPNYNAWNVAAGTSQTLSFTFTPPAGTAQGTYNVIALAFSNGYSTEYKQVTIGTLTIGSGGGGGTPAFTITGSVSPTTISTTGSSNISATFTDTGGALTNGNLEVQIYPASGSGSSIGGDAPNFNAWNVAAGGSQTLSFSFTPAAGTAPGTYNVVALAFSNGYSTEYKQVTIGTLTITGTTAPSAPTNLAATAGNATVGLTWTVSTGATSYNIYRSATSGGEGATAFATSTTPSYTDNAVINGTKYYYKVAAVNSGGTSGLSNEASATPESSTGTPAVLTTPTPGSTLSGASATFSWTAGGGVTEYWLEVGTTGAGSHDVYNSALMVTSVNVTNLPTNGATVYARLFSKINGAWQSTDYTYKAAQ
jgi:hypothetical protein